MKNQDQSLSELYEDFLAGRINPEQTERLKALFKTGDEDTLRNLVEEALKDLRSHLVIREDEQERLDGIYMRVKAEIENQKHPTKRRTLKRNLIAGIAAATVLVIASILYYSSQNRVKTHDTELLAQVQPGGNKATITLADGRAISLTDASKGILADQSGITISKNSEGIVIYSMAESSTSAAAFNTISTPKGGEYRIILSDGTKVHLNAGSSLRYPVSFGSASERRVQLTGEAYFEVSHNKAKPFKVVTATQTVTVLGTHFNVKSYADEGMTTTTLEEGSVKVVSGVKESLLKPGQESIVQGSGNVTVGQADMETALAWKDGNIVFKNADIRDIVRQIERWYDIDVDFEGRPSKRLLTGGMPRNTRLSVLLEVLKDSNIAFRMEENSERKKLIITN